MNRIGAYSYPSDVTAEQGEVLVEGPDGVAVSLTPDAAEETARRILVAVGEARRQLGLPAGAGEAGPANSGSPKPRLDS